MPDAFTDRIEEIVCAALETRTPSELSGCLEANCGNDSQLRAAVEAMLASQPAVDSFFRESQFALGLAPDICAAIASDAIPPDDLDAFCCEGDNGQKLIGPYKLLQKIGEGGCGSVYLAGQESPMRRRVALKIIKLGMDTKRVIARFEAERQALALMNHPNIARVLDAGATRSGRPYFVMELVQGVRITTYCDEHRLDARQRLGLFIQVCNAVQHAHQNGIIHRDIKPSNILVSNHDGVPVPKVIDFGIAKATTGELLTDKTLFTAFESFMGTPAYMSPEQAEMTDVDTRSDIYSLGVLLYELLTGRTPFDQQELISSGLDEMRRTLRMREPHRPSARLGILPEDKLRETAVCRRTEPRKLQSLLAGDLDWVVMKALEKDRTRRYQTANAVAMEVHRFLNDEPVVARPPHRLYRFGKLVRRNKAMFAAIGAVSLALIVGFGGSSWLFIKEREARLQQVVLRKEADEARAEEKRLRLEAEESARTSRAAILVAIGKLDRADVMIGRIEVKGTHPSLEAARVFSGLGDWNALHGRWKRAAECFLKLELANQIDRFDMSDNATRDLLRIAPTLIVAGDWAEYRRVIRESVTRFAKTDNPIAAEQVLKISTIVAPETDLVGALKPLAKVAEISLNDPSRTIDSPACIGHLVAWRALALAMYYHRCDDFASAVAWSRRALECDDRTPTRLAMTYAILAMASHRIDPARGFSELAAVRAILDEKFPAGQDGLTELGNDTYGYWNDWIMARFLYDEASQSLGNPEIAPD